MKHGTIGALLWVSACGLIQACGGTGGGGPRDAGPISVRPDATTPRIAIEQVFGAARLPAERPPVVAGGTLTASAEGPLAFVSFPDEDRLEIVDPTARVVRGEVSFAHGAEPGRVVLDASGRAHVVLRRAGAIATVDVSSPSEPAILATRAVCPVPRGVAFDAALDVLYVACASGELVRLPSAPEAAPTGVVQLGEDLRDVVVDGDRLLVSRFRAGRLEVVERSSLALLTPMALPPEGARQASAHVVWRTISRPGGGAAAVYQSESSELIDPSEPMAYGGPVSGPLVQPMLAMLDGGTDVLGTSLPGTTLAVDVAIAPDGSRLAIAQAGARPGSPCQIVVFSLRNASGTAIEPGAGGGRCVELAGGRAVAVAFTAAGDLLVQTRAPDALHLVTDEGVTLTSYGRQTHADTGLDLFHAEVGAGIACASCHPEGGDDGHVWRFVTGERRTMPLRGGIAETAPFHWDGEFTSMSALLADVMGQRMGAGPVGTVYEQLLVGYLDTLPSLAPPQLDAAAVARGRALFESAEVGCTPCHGGEHGSSEATVDVGTGGAFQVPSLRGVAYRAPYLHDGRALTLAQRFTISGGGLDRHGHTTQLDEAEIADLVVYLQSL